MTEFPPYRLGRPAGRLWRGDRPVVLRPKAWALLRYLAERPRAVVTEDELHAAVWGDTVVSDETPTSSACTARPRPRSRRRDASAAPTHVN